MVTVSMVEYDPATRKYHLTQEHAVCLTRAAGIDNLAVLTQYIWEMWKARQGGRMLPQRPRRALFGIPSVPAIASRRSNKSF